MNIRFYGPFASINTAGTAGCPVRYLRCVYWNFPRC